MRRLAQALVLPLATKLDDRDGGRDYLRIASEFYSRAESLEDLGPRRDPTSSMARWHAVTQASDPQQRDGELPTRYAAVRLALSELARRAANPRHRRHQLFTSHLVDLVEAVLQAPPSAETQRLASDRPRRCSCVPAEPRVRERGLPVAGRSLRHPSHVRNEPLEGESRSFFS